MPFDGFPFFKKEADLSGHLFYYLPFMERLYVYFFHFSALKFIIFSYIIKKAEQYQTVDNRRALSLLSLLIPGPLDGLPKVNAVTKFAVALVSLHRFFLCIRAQLS